MKSLKFFYDRIMGKNIEPPLRPRVSAKDVEMIAGMLENTGDVECDCEQVFELLGRYAELEFESEDAARLMPLLKKHLELCLDCREEYEALVMILDELRA